MNIEAWVIALEKEVAELKQVLNRGQKIIDSNSISLEKLRQQLK